MATIILTGFENTYLLNAIRNNKALDIISLNDPVEITHEKTYCDLIICRVTNKSLDSIINFVKSQTIKKPYILIFDDDCRPSIDEIKTLPDTSFLWSPIITSYLIKTIHSRIEEIKQTIRHNNSDSILSEYIGESEPIIQLKSQINHLTQQANNLLILGESGTGKDLVASLIHKKTSGKNSPYICRNCAAIPETLFESELFGTGKGAYTDAVPRPGCFELANTGTLFLDEIGELTKPFQAKLLRAIENKKIIRLGETKKRNLDFRLISATNKNLKKAVRKGVFREDLYYRINTLILKIPPLRKRKSDIPLLINHFLKDKNKRMNISAYEKMIDYKWPGNVRELSSVIDRASLITGNKDTIGPEEIMFY